MASVHQELAAPRSMRLASPLEVPPEGDPTSRLWVLGEAPGETETKELRPFCGQAGKVLDGLLQEAGISRAECYIDNVVRFRPHNNNFEEFYEVKSNGKTKKKERVRGNLLEESIAKRLSDLNQFAPQIVVCLGQEALRAITGQALIGGISSWRGSVIEGLHGGKVIGTYHPSYLLRSWQDRPITVHDLRRAKSESWNREINRKRRTIFLNRSFEETIKALEDMNANSQFVAFDIETEANSYISSIALADSGEYAVVVPFKFRGRDHWGVGEEGALRRAIKQILENPKIQKIAQNAQFDMIWLSDKWGVEVSPLYMDTMVAHSLLMPEYEKSLAFQCSIYTDIPYYKFQGRSDDPDTYFRYNGTDALATFDCAQEIQEQLEEDGLWDFYNKLPHRLLQPLRELSQRGIKVDIRLRDAMLKENAAEQKKIVEEVRRDPSVAAFEKTILRAKIITQHETKWEGSKILKKKYPEFVKYLATKELPEFNINSTKHLQEYLYKFRGFDPIYERRSDGTKTLTANAAAIKKLQSKNPGESALEAFLSFADLAKEGEFLSAKLEPDNRIHCTYDITGTETGRLSSKKYVYDSGANLQNQPAGKKKESTLRRIFIADEGKVFIQRDLKQAEAWIVAFLSRDPFFMDAIRASDIHRRTASLIFHKPESEVSKQEREMAKRCVHALNYGMGYIKFAEQVGISVASARDLSNRYFAAFPRIKMWHSEIKLKLAKDRELVTPFGRKRQFTAGWNEDLWKEAWAYLPQSTVGDLLNVGFLEFWEWLKSSVKPLTFSTPPAKFGGNWPTNEQFFDCQIMLQIHDSLIVQCPPQHVETLAAKLRECLEREIVVGGEKIRIPTDCSVGENWLDMKEVKDN